MSTAPRPFIGHRRRRDPRAVPLATSFTSRWQREGQIEQPAAYDLDIISSVEPGAATVR